MEAGVIGCSIARELSKYHLKIAVLEKECDVSQGASKANSGIVHGGYDAKHGTKKAQLSRKGNLMFEKLSEELQFGYRKVGSLVLAFNEQEVKTVSLTESTIRCTYDQYIAQTPCTVLNPASLISALYCVTVS